MEILKMTTTTTQIPDRLYYRIGDVAEMLGVKPYVLRYWETEFPMIAPEKSPSGQRVYRKSDVETVMLIKHLLYEERYSIEGARKRIAELRKQGELKAFKKSVGGEASGENTMGTGAESAIEHKRSSRERVQEIFAAAAELRALVQTPMSKLFLD